MGDKRGKRPNSKPLKSAPELARRPDDAPGSDPRAASSPGPGQEGPGGPIRKTHSIVELPDGTECIGAECAVVKINPKRGNVELDLTDCDDVVKDAIIEAVKRGAGTDYRLGR